jgi:hypothetical protein
MEKEFVPAQQSFDLKELGFDEPYFGVYYISDHYKEVVMTGRPYVYGKNSGIYKKYNVLTPTFSQAFRWFREKYKLQAEVLWRGDMGCFCYKTGKFKQGSHDFSKDDYSTYEEAELECLKKLISIVKEK